MNYIKYIPVLTLAWTAQANAAMSIYVYESGSNVIAVSSGSVNLTGLNFLGSANDAGVSWGSFGLGSKLVVGPAGVGSTYVYDGSTGPAFLGASSANWADSGSGKTFGFMGSGYVVVDRSYVSGSPMSSTSTWNSKTIAGLGLTPGTYTWTWGSGANADSATLNIGAVPEPTSMLLSMVAGGMMLIRRKR